MAEKPYKVIIEGQNGAGNQVFEAETPEELGGMFKEAQTHATAKIREQAEALRLRDEEIATMRQAGNGNGNSNGPDEMTKAWVQGLDTAVRSEFNMPLKQFAKRIEWMESVINDQQTKAMGAQLIAEMPHLGGPSQGDWEKNAQKIGQYMQENGLAMTYANLRAAAIVLDKDSKLTVTASNPDSEVVLGHVPTTVSRPAAQVNTDQSEKEFFRTAKTEDIKVYLEKKHAGARS